MSTIREQILQTTSGLLEKQGFHGTGLNEIIKESGAPKGSLYYYFPGGKEQIAAEAVLQSGWKTAERVRTGLSGTGPASQAIHDFILNVANHVESSGFGAGGPLTAVSMETATKSERINQACQEAYGLIVDAFRDKLLEGGIPAERASRTGDLHHCLGRRQHHSQPHLAYSRSSEYPDPSLEACLRSTFGLVVYEEHILQICEAFAGLNPGRADVLRRALVKQQWQVVREIGRESPRRRVAAVTTTTGFGRYGRWSPVSTVMPSASRTARLTAWRRIKARG